MNIGFSDDANFQTTFLMFKQERKNPVSSVDFEIPYNTLRIK